MNWRLPPLRELAAHAYVAIKLWMIESGRWYAVSMLSHACLFVVLGLLLGTIHHIATQDEVAFDAADAELPPETELQPFEVGETPLDPTELNTDTLTQFKAEPLAHEAEYNDDSEIFEESGGGRPLDVTDLNLGGAGMDLFDSGAGPILEGDGGVGVGIGLGENAGSGGAGSGFGNRGSGHRDKLLAGATKASERAVAAALNWIARHQNGNGSWSIDHFGDRCKSAKCDGEAYVQSDSAATALALLPFLAAGQTHKSEGPYQRHIHKGLQWLLKQQRENGDLSGETKHTTYSHGLAAITLCEAYGMTQDSWLRDGAQRAIQFIESYQNPADGGWRYHPQERGDTSVVGWQVMALKSAEMAGLNVTPAAFEGAKKFLTTVACGRYGGTFSYQQGTQETTTLTSVGMLCRQYLGTPRGDAGMLEGTTSLMSNLPDNSLRNVYYWYYATQVMHNQPGAEWDQWNRKIRRLLIDTQVKSGCAAGSWDPLNPEPDQWGRHGGRLMVTSLSCLTLEVYYRYLPIYRLNKDVAVADPAPGAAKEETTQ